MSKMNSLNHYSIVINMFTMYFVPHKQGKPETDILLLKIIINDQLYYVLKDLPIVASSLNYIKTFH